jgi:hypothetical protein
MDKWGNWEQGAEAKILVEREGDHGEMHNEDVHNLSSSNITWLHLEKKRGERGMHDAC